MGLRKSAIIVGYAFVGWALCGAIVGIGLSVTSEQTALIAHAIGAPIVFGVVSWLYYRRSGAAAPLRTAMTFLGLVILMDFFLAGLLIQRSLAMFANPLGTWIPFGLIFVSVYLVGVAMKARVRA